MKTNEKISGALTRKQEAAITALLAQPSMKDAAASAGVSVPTLWRWLQNDDFQSAYMKARRESVRQAVAHLQQASGEAVDVLREVMNGKEATAAARVSAARAIIEFAIKAVEVEDLAERVKQLEALLEPKK